MNGRPQVLVAVGSDTLALRMRLMLEAEGAEPVVMAGPLPAEVRAVLAVAAPAASDRVRQVAPGVPIIEVADGEDWDGLRRRLAEALGHGQASPPPSEAEALAAALQRARILLVDDSVTYREFLRHELARLGAVVTVCPDPAKAVAHLEQGGWDGVLIDLVMPGVDGAQLCSRAARLRRDHGQSFVLAVLSSRESSADLIRSLEAGADLFLGKSQDVSLIRVKLGALLRRRQLG